MAEYKNEDQPWWSEIPTTKELAATQITELANEIDLVIMTATEVERDALLRRLSPLPPRRKIVTGFVGPETYFIGKFGEFNVVITKCRMGSAGPGSATLAADQAQRIWRPQAIIMVGIAFGKDTQRSSGMPMFWSPRRSSSTSPSGWGLMRSSKGGLSRRAIRRC